MTRGYVMIPRARVGGPRDYYVDRGTDGPRGVCVCVVLFFLVLFFLFFMGVRCGSLCGYVSLSGRECGGRWRANGV